VLKLETRAKLHVGHHIYGSVVLYWPSPSDSLGIWLIDCSASRHFIEYMGALSNLVEMETIVGLYLEPIPPIPEGV